MSLILRDIYGAIAIAEVPWDQIDVIAFDIMDTLVEANKSGIGRRYNAVAAISEAYNDARALAKHNETIEVYGVSSIPGDAEKALHAAGLDTIVEDGLEVKTQFYERMKREGKHVLAIDDNFWAAIEASAIINPTHQKVRDFFESPAYRSALAAHLS